jgi:peptide/nickel transport system substrate-binding protein
MIGRKRALGLGLVVTLAVVGVACGGSSKSSSGATGGGGSKVSNLSIGETLAPASLDITTASGAAIPQALLYNVYETPVKLDDTGKFQPLLAKSWKVSDDGLTYTFSLQSDVKFANGDTVDANVIKTAYDAQRTSDKAPALVKATWAPVASIAAADPATLVITLKQPSRNFLFNLAQTGGVVYDPKTLADIATKTNGTGPYALKEFVTNSSLSLVRNDKYWGTKPAANTVTFKYYSDPNALANGIKAGDIQIIDNLTPELFQPFKADTANYETVEGQTDGEVIVAFNNGKAPLNDVRVRQALTYGIDKKAVVAAAESGFAKIIGSHASTNDPWFLDLSNTYQYDPNKAKQLLQQAGQPNINLTLQVIPTPYAKSVSQVVQSELGKIGVNVTLKDVEFPLWLDQVFTKHDYDLTVVAHVEARDVNQYGNPQYYWNYNDKTTQDLLAKADATTDEKASNDLYQQVLKRINEQAVNDWLYLLPRLEVVKKGITGYPKATTTLSYDVTTIK